MKKKNESIDWFKYEDERNMIWPVLDEVNDVLDDVDGKNSNRFGFDSLLRNWDWVENFRLGKESPLPMDPWNMIEEVVMQHQGMDPNNRGLHEGWVIWLRNQIEDVTVLMD